MNGMIYIWFLKNIFVLFSAVSYCEYAKQICCFQQNFAKQSDFTVNEKAAADVRWNRLV